MNDKLSIIIFIYIYNMYFMFNNNITIVFSNKVNCIRWLKISLYVCVFRMSIFKNIYVHK